MARTRMGGWSAERDGRKGLYPPRGLGAADEARRLLSVDGAILYCWDAALGALCAASWSANGPGSRESAVLAEPPLLSAGQGVAGRAFSRREPVVVDGYEDWTYGVTWARVAGITGAMAVPLIDGAMARGALVVYSQTGRRSSAADVDRLRALALRVAPTIDDLATRAVAERRRIESDALAALMREAPDRDVESLAARVTATAGRLLGADYAVVMRDDDEKVTGVSWHGPWGTPALPRPQEDGDAPPSGMARSEALHEWVELECAEEGSPEATLATLPIHRVAGGRTALRLPLMVDGRIRGALVVGWRSAVAVSEATTHLAEALAAYATMADEAWLGERRAVYDPLTELPNRTLFHDRLQQAALVAVRAGSPLALLLFDLDHFKDINDTLGHHYGDMLLQEVARRLRKVLRASDTVARLGGDEFAVLLPGGNRAGAARAARKIAAALNKPIVVDGQRLYVAASIGAALYPEHGDDPHTLLRRADIAMYSAKRNRSGHAFYSASADMHSPERLALNEELRHAIAHDELVLHYQPRVVVHDGAKGERSSLVAYGGRGLTPCVEALVRWEHPRHGLLPPDQFIPLAEATGLIGPLTQWVLAHAIRQCRAWRDAGVGLGVAVNLSAANLRDPRLAATIFGLLDTHGVAPSALTVELTESTVMADAEQAMAMLARLSAHGIHVAIDDFGTGYSSLAYLKRLPVTQLKIDKSFVLHMAEDDADRAIVSSTIGLGHNLGLHVVAEGVEDERSWELLAAMKCDGAQGYYLSRPLCVDGLAAWLKDYAP